MKVTLLRHCRSLFNEFGVTDRDVGLSDSGKKHASSLHGHFDVVLCSPLTRALDTLRLSTITFKELYVTSNLRETRNGNSVNYFPREDVSIIQSPKDLYKQVEVLCQEIMKHSGKSVLCVGHSDLFCAMLGRHSISNGEFLKCELELSAKGYTLKEIKIELVS